MTCEGFPNPSRCGVVTGSGMYRIAVYKSSQVSVLWWTSQYLTQPKNVEYIFCIRWPAKSMRGLILVAWNGVFSFWFGNRWWDWTARTTRQDRMVLDALWSDPTESDEVLGVHVRNSARTLGNPRCGQSQLSVRCLLVGRIHAVLDLTEWRWETFGKKDIVKLYLYDPVCFVVLWGFF